MNSTALTARVLVTAKGSLGGCQDEVVYSAGEHHHGAREQRRGDGDEHGVLAIHQGADQPVGGLAAQRRRPRQPLIIHRARRRSCHDRPPIPLSRAWISPDTIVTRTLARVSTDAKLAAGRNAVGSLPRRDMPDRDS
jgi:hypothetical protein